MPAPLAVGTLLFEQFILVLGLFLTPKGLPAMALGKGVMQYQAPGT